MNLLNNLSMGKKLILFTAIAVIGIGIIGIIGISSLNVTTSSLDNLFDVHMHNIQKIEDTKTDFILYSRSIANHLSAPNEERRTHWEKTMAEQDALGRKALSEYTIQTDKGRELITRIESEWGQYTTAVTGLVELSNAGKIDEARKYRDDVTFPLLEKVTKTLDETNAHVKGRAQQAKQESDAAAAGALTSIMLISLLVVIILIAFAFILTRSITGPLNRVVEMLNEISKGHLGMRLALDQKDELGVMAASLDNYVEKLQLNLIGTIKRIAAGEKGISFIPAADEQDEIAPAVNTMISTIDSILEEVGTLISDAQDGNLKTRGDPAKFVGSYQEIIVGINNMLQAITTPLNEALRVADLFAHAKFGSRFDESVQVKGDLIALKEGLNTVGRELSQVIQDVSEQVSQMTASSEEAAASIEEVTAGSNNVAESSAKVSSNADSSVRSVEQVLTAMEELSTSVTTVASKVDSVSRLSQGANEVSVKGVAQAGVAEDGIKAINGAVGDVGSIISEIRVQMNEIGKIVEIIGGIADQTNLLSLNASIEAARAGEAGMGFAVVANEVKALAQESQGSAENIAQIISNLQKQSERAAIAMEQANTEVKKGSDAITETIQYFHTIAEQVSDISQNMTEVASLSEEEAAAVEEITASVSEVKSLADNTSLEATSSAAASEQSSAALNQVATIISDLSIVAARINESMQRLNG